MTQTNTAGNTPEKKFRAGAVSATVWLNHGQNKKDGAQTSWRTISLQRGYKDNNDQWQNTGSMRVNDLPRAALMLSKAYEYIVTKQQESPEDSATTSVNEEPVM